MVFSSFTFLWVFLPAALLAYYSALRYSVRAANRVLALSGYVFYAWSSPKFLVLLWATTAVDWVAGLIIAGDSWRFWRLVGGDADTLESGAARSMVQRRAITTSVVVNLASLGFFKYAGFLARSAREIATSLGLAGLADHPTLHIILPLGISFYTFQSLSYTIDVYRGHAKPMTRFWDFACFVSMFPHLVAGPILRFSFLADQLIQRTVTSQKVARGIALFSLGMAKKVALANPSGAMADALFSAQSIGSGDAWAGAVAYAMQIYFDFSGYSDMAVGLGLMMGFVFARNFDAPYRATSVTDFWRRWHISLSSWLRDYLYIPLGGSQRGKGRTYANLIVTMLLGGLWHGAAWSYVAWGGIHGTALALERAGGEKALSRLPGVLRGAFVFLFVMFAWVVFRSSSFHDALSYVRVMFGGGAPDATTALVRKVAYTNVTLGGLFAALCVTWAGADAWRFTARLTVPKSALLLSLLVASAALLSVQSYNPFIYFIF